MKIIAMIAVATAVCVSACAKTDATGQEATGAAVVSSGKEMTALSDVPPEVIAAATAARPGMSIAAAEYETRNGAEYYDVGGMDASGAEVELDLTRIEGVWTVVEIQRDITQSESPPLVLEALYSAKPGFKIARIIESDQGDGVVIYEFYQEGAGGDLEKAEVKFEAGRAELLLEEWAH